MMFERVRLFCHDKAWKWRGVGMLLTVFVSSCMPIMETYFAEGANPLLLYVQGADLYLDDIRQREDLKQFFKDMINYSPSQMHKRRYTNDQGVPNSWTAPEFLQYHVHPVTPGVKEVNSETFYDDMDDMQVKSIFVYWIQNIDGLYPGK